MHTELAAAEANVKHEEKTTARDLVALFVNLAKWRFRLMSGFERSACWRCLTTLSTAVVLCDKLSRLFTGVKWNLFENKWPDHILLLYPIIS